MTKIQINANSFTVWFWSDQRKRWELPLHCSTLETALNITSAFGALIGPLKPGHRPARVHFKVRGPSQEGHSRERCKKRGGNAKPHRVPPQP